MLQPSQLLAILSNPSETSGSRTLKRVRKISLILGFETFQVENLFPLATRSSGGIALVGTLGETWKGHRFNLDACLSRADAVLLAHGLGKPRGPAGLHYEEQLVWLNERLAHKQIPTFMVGDGPRHPSRWQRHTHRAYPELTFDVALARSVRRIDGGM